MSLQLNVTERDALAETEQVITDDELASIQAVRRRFLQRLEQSGQN